jgi:hypothetical protein
VSKTLKNCWKNVLQNSKSIDVLEGKILNAEGARGEKMLFLWEGE